MRRREWMSSRIWWNNRMHLHLPLFISHKTSSNTWENDAFPHLPQHLGTADDAQASDFRICSSNPNPPSQGVCKESSLWSQVNENSDERNLFQKGSVSAREEITYKMLEPLYDPILEMSLTCIYLGPFGGPDSKILKETGKTHYWWNSRGLSIEMPRGYFPWAHKII